MAWLWLLGCPALAGYGDPVDGVPIYAEREVHLWTNAVRVQPDAFATEYPCAWDAFTATEKTPQRPLWWHTGLGTAARFHSEDMETSGLFSHNSSDGTSAEARMLRYYPGDVVGENIAQGYMSPRDVVIEGWMCSSGHRENIMYPEWDDLGTGVSGDYWTQDFGFRGYDPTLLAARLGLHFPAFPADEATYRLAVHTGDQPPERVDVVVNGVHHAMDVRWGVEASGVYEADVPLDGEPCSAYWFEVEKQGGTVDQYPQDGAFGFGDCPWTDQATGWIERADIPALQVDPADADAQGCGCATTPAGPGWLAGLLVLGLRRRR